MSYILEVVADSVTSAINAEKGGANRIELCQNLIIGGTSPSIELFNIVRENTNIKINVLLRPRFGDFCYNDFEFELLKREITLFNKARADGIIIGMLKPDGNLDIEKMKVLIDLAKGMHVTLHRCIDVSQNPLKTLDESEKLGINTILTSGQQNKAIDGIGLIKNMHEKAKQVSIMAGSSIDSNNIKIFLEKTNLTNFHLSGKTVLDSNMQFRNKNVTMGLALMSEFEIWETEIKEIKKVKEILDNKFLK